MKSVNVNHTIKHTILPLTVLLALSSSVEAEESGPRPFIYESNSTDAEASLRCVVGSDGISNVTLGNRVVASGQWKVQDFSTIVDFVSNYDWRKARRDATWDFKDKRLEIVDAKHARVIHRSSEIEAVYDYLFDGEDIEIRCAIRNLTEGSVVQAVKFNGLTFHFDKEPTGLFCPQAVVYPVDIIPTCRAAGFHPCFSNPLGGSELADDNVGVGATPLRTGALPTVLAWEGAKAKDKALQYVRAITITPGSVVRCDFQLRISRNRDWKYLLQPYRRHFRDTFGAVRYKNSNRPIGFLNAASDRWIKDGNPFGYLEHFRFDTAAGTSVFIAETIPMLKRANSQGMILWSFTPYNPRGANFRPDTDVLPPQVWKNVPTMTAAFKQASLGLGICMRPQIVTTKNWEHDAVLTIHPQDQSQAALAIRPFNRFMKEGMNIFYLDTFGGGGNDAQTMIFLRGLWGDRPVFTCTEFWSDVSLLHSPGYAQYNWDKTAKAYKEFWHREHLWEVAQWLAPGVQLASPQGVWDAKHERPEGTPDPFRFLYQNHVIPIFFTATRTSGEMADQLHRLTGEFLDDQGQFVK